MVSCATTLTGEEAGTHVVAECTDSLISTRNLAMGRKVDVNDMDWANDVYIHCRMG